MINCPFCRAVNYDDSDTCAYCGGVLPKQVPQATKQPTKGMGFNSVYALLTMFGVGSSIGVIVAVALAIFVANITNIENVAPMFTFILFGVRTYDFVCSILLLLRKKLGYKLVTIQIIVGIVNSLLLAVGGVYAIAMGVTGTGEYDGLWFVVSIIALIVAIPILIWNIASFVYYKKRKDCFH